jgi:serine/threonine-protein kinase
MPALPLLADRFQLLNLVGEGSFARVYRARDLGSGGYVAIKVLKEASRSDPETVERFRRETLAVASVQSPHVVRLHEFGMSGEELFIAMEYVEGPLLRDFLGRRPLPGDFAHVVVGQIAQAVAAAHEKGIIHRDLKPENVVLVRGTLGRRVMVLDFGLAKMVELEQWLNLAPLSREGMCFGTPQYMSPEEVRGRPANKAADIWALAIIAYEIVAGHLPWDGASARDVFYAILTQPLPEITETHPSLGRREEMNAFFARAFSPKPEERPASAAAFFGAFEQALFGGPPVEHASVFDGLVAAEFLLPGSVDEMAMTEAPPIDAATEDSPMAVTPETVETPLRSSSGRRLRSVWSTTVTDDKR